MGSPLGEEEEERILLARATPPENFDEYTGDGSVDFRGHPILKHNTGNWRACSLILGTEVCERLAYYGISKSLVTYLSTRLHEGNVSAARNFTTWQGTCYLTPLIGATLADSYWGKYRTIAVFSTIYFLGMSALTLSASVPYLQPPQYQFDDTDPIERTKKGAFFNWFYFSINIGSLISGTVLIWVQEKYGYDFRYLEEALLQEHAR
uniref:Peptide transporter PTR2 n=1 Tax=Aegilops tauschii subsp. strangulata TaxID=200361 RepID=A0A453IJU2_AEGTS